MQDYEKIDIFMPFCNKLILNLFRNFYKKKFFHQQTEVVLLNNFKSIRM